MKTTTWILPVVAFGAPRQSRRDVWKPSPAVQKYRAFKDQLNLLMRGQDELWKLLEDGEPIHLVFHMPIPPSIRGSVRKVRNGQANRNKPDADNLAKAFFDALLENDSHIYDFRATKFWSEEGAIEIRRMKETTNVRLG